MSAFGGLLTTVFVTGLFGPQWLVPMVRCARLLPTNASAALTSPGGQFLDYLDWWAGGLVLLGYAVLLGGLGLVLSLRRDIT